VNRWLHLGCGDHKLPKPWENFDKEVDLREKLPFQNGVGQYIFAEHVIEHLPFRDGLYFLTECHRVLNNEGVLRFSFPDMTKIGIDALPLYAKHLKKETGKAVRNIEDVWLSIATDWGHRSVWTADVARRLVIAVGFDKVVTLPAYGQSIHSDLSGIDGRHLSEGLQLARAETTVIEAVKRRFHS
jgi:hypothetical protein